MVVEERESIVTEYLFVRVSGSIDLLNRSGGRLNGCEREKRFIRNKRGR